MTASSNGREQSAPKSSNGREQSAPKSSNGREQSAPKTAPEVKASLPPANLLSRSLVTPPLVAHSVDVQKETLFDFKAGCDLFFVDAEDEKDIAKILQDKANEAKEKQMPIVIWQKDKSRCHIFADQKGDGNWVLNEIKNPNKELSKLKGKIHRHDKIFTPEFIEILKKYHTWGTGNVILDGNLDSGLHLIKSLHREWEFAVHNKIQQELDLVIAKEVSVGVPKSDEKKEAASKKTKNTIELGKLAVKLDRFKNKYIRMIKELHNKAGWEANKKHILQEKIRRVFYRLLDEINGRIDELKHDESLAKKYKALRLYILNCLQEFISSDERVERILDKTWLDKRKETFKSALEVAKSEKVEIVEADDPWPKSLTILRKDKDKFDQKKEAACEDLSGFIDSVEEKYQAREACGHYFFLRGPLLAVAGNMLVALAEKLQNISQDKSVRQHVIAKLLNQIQDELAKVAKVMLWQEELRFTLRIKEQEENAAANAAKTKAEEAKEKVNQRDCEAKEVKALIEKSNRNSNKKLPIAPVKSGRALPGQTAQEESVAEVKKLESLYQQAVNEKKKYHAIQIEAQYQEMSAKNAAQKFGQMQADHIDLLDGVLNEMKGFLEKHETEKEQKYDTRTEDWAYCDRDTRQLFVDTARLRDQARAEKESKDRVVGKKEKKRIKFIALMDEWATKFVQFVGGKNKLEANENQRGESEFWIYADYLPSNSTPASLGHFRTQFIEQHGDPVTKKRLQFCNPENYMAKALLTNADLSRQFETKVALYLKSVGLTSRTLHWMLDLEEPITEKELELFAKDEKEFTREEGALREKVNAEFKEAENRWVKAEEEFLPFQEAVRNLDYEYAELTQQHANAMKQLLKAEAQSVAANEKLIKTKEALKQQNKLDAEAAMVLLMSETNKNNEVGQRYLSAKATLAKLARELSAQEQKHKTVPLARDYLEAEQKYLQEQKLFAQAEQRLLRATQRFKFLNQVQPRHVTQIVLTLYMLLLQMNANKKQNVQMGGGHVDQQQRAVSDVSQNLRALSWLADENEGALERGDVVLQADKAAFKQHDLLLKKQAQQVQEYKKLVTKNAEKVQILRERAQDAADNQKTDQPGDEKEKAAEEKEQEEETESLEQIQLQLSRAEKNLAEMEVKQDKITQECLKQIAEFAKHKKELEAKIELQDKSRSGDFVRFVASIRQLTELECRKLINSDRVAPQQVTVNNALQKMVKDYLREHYPDCKESDVSRFGQHELKRADLSPMYAKNRELMTALNTIYRHPQNAGHWQAFLNPALFTKSEAAPLLELAFKLIFCIEDQMLFKECRRFYQACLAAQQDSKLAQQERELQIKRCFKKYLQQQRIPDRQKIYKDAVGKYVKVGTFSDGAPRNLVLNILAEDQLEVTFFTSKPGTMTGDILRIYLHLLYHDFNTLKNWQSLLQIAHFNQGKNAPLLRLLGELIFFIDDQEMLSECRALYHLCKKEFDRKVIKQAEIDQLTAEFLAQEGCEATEINNFFSKEAKHFLPSKPEFSLLKDVYHQPKHRPYWQAMFNPSLFKSGQNYELLKLLESLVRGIEDKRFYEACRALHLACLKAFGNENFIRDENTVLIIDFLNEQKVPPQDVAKFLAEEKFVVSNEVFVCLHGVYREPHSILKWQALLNPSFHKMGMGPALLELLVKLIRCIEDKALFKECCKLHEACQRASRITQKEMQEIRRQQASALLPTHERKSAMVGSANALFSTEQRFVLPKPGHAGKEDFFIRFFQEKLNIEAKLACQLVRHGFFTLKQLWDQPIENLLKIPEMDHKIATDLKEKAFAAMLKPYVKPGYAETEVDFVQRAARKTKKAQRIEVLDMSDPEHPVMYQVPWRKTC